MKYRKDPKCLVDHNRDVRSPKKQSRRIVGAEALLKSLECGNQTPGSRSAVVPKAATCLLDASKTDQANTCPPIQIVGPSLYKIKLLGICLTTSGYCLMRSTHGMRGDISSLP